MAWWDKLATIGGAIAAPFTGGASLWPTLALTGANVAGSYLANRGKGGGGDLGEALKPYQAMLQQGAERKTATAGEFGGMSTEALVPALKYLTDLLGADPGALMDATRQERGRVIDQYDTARRAIATFGPRGGGSTSALAESRFDQAESLADITSTARRDAVSMTADLGTRLASLGLTAEQLASADISTIIESLLGQEQISLQKRGQNMQALGGLGESLGSLFGLFLTRKGGAWERAGA